MAAQRKRVKKPSKPPNTRGRIMVLQAALMLIMVLLAVRLYQLQITQHDFYARKVLPRGKHEPARSASSRRGGIYDRQGRELAVSIRLSSVYGIPGQLRAEERENIRRVCNILQVEPGSLEHKLESRQHFIWLKRKITPQVADRLEELNLAGIGFREENQRYYPARELAAQVLGFTGMDNHGLEGAELYYDQALSEAGLNEGGALAAISAPGADIGNLPKPAGACNILLTIDKVIQYQTEKELIAACTAAQAKAGTAIVMEVKSGHVLAMANWPQFNPNSFSKYPVRFRRNRCLTDAFEPGSIFKIFLAAAALETGRVGPNTVIFCENGVFHIGRRMIRDTHKHGMLTFSEVIKMSSNIGSAKVGLSLDREKFYTTLKELGFGSETGIRLPGEARGIVPPLRKWTDLTTANISFGHGILVTPLQIITAVSCLANEGWWREPAIVQGLMNEEGEVFDVPDPGPVRRVVSRNTCRTLIGMLEGVVRDGTGTAADIPGYRVAGKTGTAQKVDPVTRRYSQELFNSSFVGFFPANAPQIAILVTIDEPMGEHLAGIVAAPVFRRIAKSVISYLNIPPVQERGTPAADSLLRLADGAAGSSQRGGAGINGGTGTMEKGR
ncbi:MAG: penicillin-binding protein 2 [bacterium]